MIMNYEYVLLVSDAEGGSTVTDDVLSAKVMSALLSIRKQNA
jgi:hypothetical protein